MHEKIETQIFNILQNRLPNDFFEKLTEKVQEEMQETGMIVQELPLIQRISNIFYPYNIYYITI